MPQLHALQEVRAFKAREEDLDQAWKAAGADRATRSVGRLTHTHTYDQARHWAAGGDRCRWRGALRDQWAQRGRLNRAGGACAAHRSARTDCDGGLCADGMGCREQQLLDAKHQIRCEVEASLAQVATPPARLRQPPIS